MGPGCRPTSIVMLVYRSCDRQWDPPKLFQGTCTPCWVELHCPQDEAIQQLDPFPIVSLDFLILPFMVYVFYLSFRLSFCSHIVYLQDDQYT